VRFELEPGRPVNIVLEPWEKRITLHDVPYPGDKPETIRTWGRDRLRLLARLLPLVDNAEVFLLGTGLPSFWSIKMGEMRLLLGLSGWTANDWTGASALDAVAPPAEPSEKLMAAIGAAFLDSPTLTFDQVCQKTNAPAPNVAAGLNRFALLGQLIHDLAANVYRWRQIMPVELSLQQVKLDSPETEAAKKLVARVRVGRDERTASGLRVVTGSIGRDEFEAVLDGDDKVIRGKCNCSHHFKFRLRAGPCRHLQALRLAVQKHEQLGSLDKWYQWLTR
jgi:hypothetical protein